MVQDTRYTHRTNFTLSIEAAELMEHFYGELRAGARAETALRTAMRRLRAERPHPYHWAPFVLIGRGGVVATPKRRISPAPSC